jgi:integrase
MASFSNNTISQYNSSLRSWWIFCQNNNYDFYEATPSQLLSFLTKAFEKGGSYSTLNTHRSALSIVLGKETTTNYCVNQFLKGAFRLNPPKPKYDHTWDTVKVLDYLSKLYPYNTISLKDLAFKSATLLAIASAQRMQTLSLIKLHNIEINNEDIVIKVPDLIKTSRPGAFQPIIKLPFIPENPSICPALAIKCYIEKTATLREQSDDHLFISIQRPFKNVRSQTIGHWVKKVLSDSGIDIKVFGAHSTRHASTSAAHKAGVSLDVLRKAAGWSDKSNVFLKYYRRETINSSNNEFVNAIFDVQPTN